MKRSALLVGLLLATAPLSVVQAQETINYITAGGVYLENIRKAFLDPIGKELNVTWNVETSDVDTPVRIQFQSGAVTTDIAEFGASVCAQGAAEGMYEKLDLSIIDTKDFAPGSFSDYYLGSTVYSIVMAWNPKTVKEAPKTWADFWDVEKFPGKRAMRKDPRATIEAALLADGVPLKELYPLDLDRAFKKLSEIKPHITAWWNSGAESQQMLRDGGIDMIAMYNARAESVKSDGGSVDYTFNEGLMDFGCWAIVKGSDQVDLSMKILAEFAKPEYQAEMTVLSNYGSANTKAADTGKIPAETLSKIPTSPENIANQAFLAPDWWAEHGAEAKERFDQLLTQ
ncbi:putative spermidine/putrescine transport system substrate-binding protein [Rhodoligotrophos appendicifer]|uniref:ABC transporter substrate-binding protein n=1 Tax=Rhodoligotrophos appendicifer TaxID=987056 RepID=UPI001185DC2E|nr:ABC transporter substrate-binding protein [Rhodoligotrophos appendicifer]